MDKNYTNSIERFESIFDRMAIIMISYMKLIIIVI